MENSKMMRVAVGLAISIKTIKDQNAGCCPVAVLEALEIMDEEITIDNEFKGKNKRKVSARK